MHILKTDAMDDDENSMISLASLTPQTWTIAQGGFVKVQSQLPSPRFLVTHNCIANMCWKDFNHVDPSIILIHFMGR